MKAASAVFTRLRLAQHPGANYGFTALEAECREVGATRVGRNAQLVRSSFRIGQLVAQSLLPLHEAEQRLFAAATANGYVAKDGAAAARDTIRSGLRAGIKAPRVVSPSPVRSVQPSRTLMARVLQADVTPPHRQRRHTSRKSQVPSRCGGKLVARTRPRSFLT